MASEGRVSVLIKKMPKIMGVLNVTPDSFSDGGEYVTIEKAKQKVESLISDGVDIIDVGGESTRPGAATVSTEEELSRVIPVVQWIRSNFDVQISVDTSSPEVILAADSAGADILNDVRALSRPGALQAAARTKMNICLMHMLGQPETMQDAPEYEDVASDVLRYLKQRILLCNQAGIDSSRIMIDPGFGFGKTLEHNLTMLRELDRFKSLGFPLLVGMSRKSMLGQITGKSVGQRLPASLAVAMIAAQKGADIIRVHDVSETKDVLKVLSAIENN